MYSFLYYTMYISNGAYTTTEKTMTKQQAKNLILTQVNNKAQSYNFDTVIIEPITEATTGQITGYCISAKFTAKYKNHISNYNAKIITLNDGSIFKL